MLLGLFFDCLLVFLLLVHYLHIVRIHVFNLQLKIANDIFDIPLCLGDALGVVLDEFSHDGEHALFVAAFVDVVELLYLD